VWAVSYHRPRHYIFSLQDDIVRRIVTTLNLQLDAMQQGFDVRQTTDNVEAYDDFLRGLAYVWDPTKDNNAKMREMFEKATELDPKYAAAYALLGRSYFMDWTFQWSLDPLILDRAFQLEQQALALDNSLAFAHMVLGQVYLYKKQFDQATAEAERATGLDPNSAFGYRALASIMDESGKPAEAIGVAEKAMRLDPRNQESYLYWEGFSYTQMGRYEEAIRVLKRHLARYPDLAAHYLLAIDYIELGREDEARAEAAEVLRMNPQFSLEVNSQRSPQKDETWRRRSLADARKAGLK
jgi:tetratricopeptide (TPR) repeat protein